MLDFNYSKFPTRFSRNVRSTRRSSIHSMYFVTIRFPFRIQINFKISFSVPNLNIFCLQCILYVYICSMQIIIFSYTCIRIRCPISTMQNARICCKQNEIYDYNHHHHHHQALNISKKKYM